MVLPTPAVGPSGPSGNVERELLETVKGLLTELGSDRAAERLTLASSFDSELGLGSLERVELLMRVERRFSVRLPDEVAQRAETPAEWIKALEAPTGAGVSERYPIVQPGPAPDPPADAKTFAEVLRRFADSSPERVQIHLLEEDRGQDISYGQLYQSASEVAAGLVESGLEPGETVAIMLPTCADFFYAFFGVTLAGGVAVPIYPPARPRQVEEYLGRQFKILGNAEVRYLISFEQAKPVAQVMRVGLRSLREVTTVDDLRARGKRRVFTPPATADTFFIQYTSGSTGNPKGVVLSHSNVLANVKGIGWAVQARPDDVVVSWLPLYHDMGLIGSWLFSLYHGFPITILSPLDFLSRPERWLLALSDSGGTLCPAPNFSFELCVRKITDDMIEGVDLSRWRVAINAGEAVMAPTLRAFARRFAGFGFKATSYVPCYGLAESSVALTFPPIDRHPIVDVIDRQTFESQGRAATASDGPTLEFVANGRPLPEHEIKLVDIDGNELGERRRGRILFRGPSKTAGYFRNPEATSEVVDSDGWMDSGDLGYWADGELFVTGRLKEAIIKSGHNIIPQEVELAASSVEGVRKGCVAAFGSADSSTGTERIVIVAESRASSKAERAHIEQGVVEAVSTKVGMPPDEVRLVKPYTVPKTSSGKIRRSETRRLYEENLLDQGTDSSPAVQLIRVGAAQATGWARIASESLRKFSRQAWKIAVGAALGVPLGLLARILPSRCATAIVSRLGLRLCAAALGERVASDGGQIGSGPCVILANRSGGADAQSLQLAFPRVLLIGEERALRDVGFPASFLLEPLVVPEAGSLDERLEAALEAGFDVALTSDNAAGEPPERCRFRLEAFLAAQQTRASVVPAFIGTSAVRFGQPLAGVRGAAAREEVRRQLRSLEPGAGGGG